MSTSYQLSRIRYDIANLDIKAAQGAASFGWPAMPQGSSRLVRALQGPGGGENKQGTSGKPVGRHERFLSF